MDAKRLRLLREFADRGSVGAVADAMHMTPSAVSQQLKVLGKEAGVELLVADGRRVRLTAAGKALVIRADDVVAAIERAKDEMNAYRSGSPQVSLAMFPSGAALLLPGLLDTLRSIDVAVTEFDVGYTEAAAGLADYDVVLTHRDERAPSIREPRVAVTELMREPLDVVVSERNDLAAHDVVDVSELSDCDWISVEGGLPIDDALLSISALTGVAPRVTHRLRDFTPIEALVAADHGIALLPRFVVRDPRVKRLELKGIRSARVYEALTRPHPRESVSQVVDALCGAATRVVSENSSTRVG